MLLGVDVGGTFTDAVLLKASGAALYGRAELRAGLPSSGEEAAWLWPDGVKRLDRHNGPVTAHLDSSSTVQTVAARQVWEYRTVVLDVRASSGPELQRFGGEGWEAVGLVQTSDMKAAVLLKRPR